MNIEGATTMPHTIDSLKETGLQTNQLEPERLLYKERVLQNLALVIVLARTFLPLHHGQGLTLHSVDEQINPRTAHEILVRSEVIFKASDHHSIVHSEAAEQREGHEEERELGDPQPQGVVTVVKPIPKLPFQILENRMAKKDDKIVSIILKQEETKIQAYPPLADALKAA